jgi:hypothetical protein
MTRKILLAFGLVTLFIGGCATPPPYMDKDKKTVSKNYSFVNGTVVADFGQDVVVEMNDDLNLFKDTHYSSRLANSILSNSIFLVGQKTYVDEFSAEIKDIRGDQVTLTLKEDIPMVKGMKVKIYLPKKKIAVLDFGIKENKNSENQKLAMNELITKLVQSGQFIVVEREKIDMILQEHQLIDSGLLEQNEAKKLGKLVAADVVLTGNMIKEGANWNTYLRLIDVSSGVIVGAIKEQISLKEFNPLEKNSENLTESFENQLGKGWVISPKTNGDCTASSLIDLSQGANHSSKSLRIDYKIGNSKSGLGIFNNIARDLTNYQGIKFWAKASSDDVVLTFRIKDVNKNDSYDNAWQARSNLTTSWKEYNYQFSELYLANGYAKTNPNGDGVLDLDMVKSVVFAIQGDGNKLNSEKTFWIDEISLY